jgi:hypothetical protein
VTRRISIAIFVCTAATALAQAPKEFDVAAIKLNLEGGEQYSVRTPPGGRFTARNITVRTVLLDALGIRDFQLEGAPKWLDAERYDIDARADFVGSITPAELMPLVRGLLVSRFGLVFHHETKDAPIYSLVAARNGARLHPNTGTPGHSTDWGKDHINAMDVTLTELAEGIFDFKLTWTPSAVTDLTGPSIFTAIQEQYGLRLAAAKGPVEMTVIDRVERPSGN